MPNPSKLVRDRTQQLSVALPDTTRRKLTFIAGERGISVAALIRELVDAGLDHQTVKAPTP